MHFYAAACSILLCLASTPLDEIAWQGDWDAALARAASEHKLVFLAVNMDGEAANNQAATSLYRDPRIAELAGHAVCLIASAGDHPGASLCPRFGALACSEHRRVDIAAREHVLKADAEGFVIAPQHVFLDGSGKVLLSVPYQISAAELEWCFVTALKELEPGFNWNLSSAARSPKRLVQGGVYDPTGAASDARVPTREEVLRLIEEVKKGGMAGERLPALRVILAADEPEAIAFIQGELRRSGGKAGGGDVRVELLHAIGARSPASYWEMVADFLDDGSPLLRVEACVAMEQLGAAGAVKELSSLLAKEKDPVAQKDLLRALAACGADDAKVREKVLRIAEKEKHVLLRLNAIVALGHFPPEDAEVRRLLAEKLSATLPEEQTAAACAMAFARDASWIPALEGALAGETTPAFKEALHAALQVLREGRIEVLCEPMMSVAKDKIRRERYFGLSGNR